MIPGCFRRKFTGESPEYIIVTRVSFDGFNLNITGNDDYFSPVLQWQSFSRKVTAYYYLFLYRFIMQSVMVFMQQGLSIHFS